MKGEAKAPGALTVINAIATLKGSAFAIDLHTKAEVEIYRKGEEIKGEIEGNEEKDTGMIERCVELVLDRFEIDSGAWVNTTSEIPTAAGLKSSSAAANATIKATLDALDAKLDPVEATRIGVQAARDAGVTITGAMDDASASMLGGLVITDNSRDELLKRKEVDWKCALYIPPEKAHSKDTDVERTKLIGPVIDEAFNLAMEGNYGKAMTINGLAYCAALGFSTDPTIDALKHAKAAGLSGTGPSYGAIGTSETVQKVVKEWEKYEGRILKVETNNQGALRVR